ncbi:hypothetical protein HAX54_037997 [Datura stramonium]|uniref:Uncharacterized protein n=1 Tax=Datura stramonium TaxID=4076 RepID=A0ABS8VM84_DATST|nr:hypothetical protein [Datura stramonium]
MHFLGTASCGLRKQCMWLNVVHVIQLRQGKLECCQGGLDQQGATDRRMAPIGRACKRWDDSARQWHGQELDGRWHGRWYRRQPGMCAGVDAHGTGSSWPV